MALIVKNSNIKEKEVVQSSNKKYSINESKKMKILDEMLAFLAANPNANAREIAYNSNSLAKKHRVSKMAVAGVRASLSKGSYGPKEKLIAKKKRELSKKS